MTAKTGRCSKMVDRSGYARATQCKNKGVLTEGGYLWCRHHAPSTTAARMEKARKRAQEQYRKLEQREQERAWKLVIEQLHRMNPKLAQEVKQAAKKREAG